MASPYETDANSNRQLQSNPSDLMDEVPTIPSSQLSEDNSNVDMAGNEVQDARERYFMPGIIRERRAMLPEFHLLGPVDPLDEEQIRCILKHFKDDEARVAELREAYPLFSESGTVGLMPVRRQDHAEFHALMESGKIPRRKNVNLAYPPKVDNYWSSPRIPAELEIETSGDGDYEVVRDSFLHGDWIAYSENRLTQSQYDFIASLYMRDDTTTTNNHAKHEDREEAEASQSGHSNEDREEAEASQSGHSNKDREEAEAPQ